MGGFTGGALHDVADLILAVVGTGVPSHDPGIVPHEYGLATDRHHFLVFDAAECKGGEAGTVDD